MVQGTTQEVVTQESLLLGTAERVGRMREGRTVLHLHLSKLRPHHRQDAHLRIALRMFDPLSQYYRGQIFLLSNSDIVVMVKDARTTDLQNLIYKLRALFSKDPLTFSDAGDGRDNFCTWYDLSTQYDAFLRMAQEMDAAVRQRNREQAGNKSSPIEPKTLGTVLERLSTTDVAGLVRRQSAVSFHDKRSEILFQEFFVSIGELQRALAPEVGLLANRWLFQHLSQTLDQRVISALRDMALKSRPPAISLNVNVSTILSPTFQAFEKWIKAPIVVELQIIDLVADHVAYMRARDWLHERAHKVLIDALDPLVMEFIDVGLYGADLFKLSWSPELPISGQADAVLATFRALGMDKVVLTRCDSEQAIQWGFGVGIERFQGRYVDAMMAAMTMAGCSASSACTFAQCIQRRGVLAGGPRGECGNLDMLDGFPRIAVPQRKTSPQGGQT